MGEPTRTPDMEMNEEARKLKLLTAKQMQSLLEQNRHNKFAILLIGFLIF